MTFLPITVDEIKKRGWASVDVVLITGDAYVDHPSFGTAVIGRLIESQNYKVAILPQPNWQDDLRDFRKFGKPNLFFAITAGAMDSMVNHYTANKRLRSTDAYTPGNQHGFRPDYATITYSKIVRKLYPDALIILGGVEASLRRFSHYDYWSNKLMPSILIDSQADFLIYGMGEKPVIDILKNFKTNQPIEHIKQIPQIAFLETKKSNYNYNKQDDVILHSFKEELNSKTAYAENFIKIEHENNAYISKKIIQEYDDRFLIVNPKNPPLTEKELDEFSDLKYIKEPHPKYKKRGEIPAFEMIKNSINIHRGCFGGCAFCAITAHQGRFISSRSEASILQEVKELTEKSYFKGHISDLGGPTANMYQMGGVQKSICLSCHKPSCLFPKKCLNLNDSHYPLIQLYRKVRQMPKVKKITIGSGVRYDLLKPRNPEHDQKSGLENYLTELIVHHVSGRLKVAPEHTSDRVLKLMRKNSFTDFENLKRKFNEINYKNNLNQQLIPYFIASHPGCTIEDMADLAIKTKKLGYKLEQVQDFTPTPMTFSTTVYYLGYNPYTQEKIYSAKNEKDRKEQQLFFFWYKSENKSILRKILMSLKKYALIEALLGH